MTGVLVAQITDPHVRRKGDLLHHMIHTGRELRRCVAALNARFPRPTFVVATGDLVDRGKKKEYRRLRAILAELEMPVYLLAGNHDDPDGLRDAFGDHAYLPRTGPLCYAVETRPMRLVALDSTRGRKPGGELNEQRLVGSTRRCTKRGTSPHSLPCITRRSMSASYRSMRSRCAVASRSKRSSGSIRRSCGSSAATSISRPSGASAARSLRRRRARRSSSSSRRFAAERIACAWSGLLTRYTTGPARRSSPRSSAPPRHPTACTPSPSRVLRPGTRGRERGHQGFQRILGTHRVERVVERREIRRVVAQSVQQTTRPAVPARAAR